METDVLPLPHHYLPHCGMSSLFFLVSDSGRYVDEFRLQLFSEALDGGNRRFESRQGVSGHPGKQVLLGGAQVPGAGPGPAQTGQAAAGRAAAGAGPFRRAGELARGERQVAQVHEHQVFKIEPHCGHMAAGGLAGGAGLAAEAVQHWKQGFQTALQVPGCMAGRIKRSLVPDTQVL